MRSFSAIRYQDPMIPTIIPNTAQISPNPMLIAAPGNAKSSQADSPDALSEKAVTHGPSFLQLESNLLASLKIYKKKCQSIRETINRLQR